MQFAIGDEHVKPPRRIAEPIDKIAHGRQQTGAGAEVARWTKDVAFGLVGPQIADFLDSAAVLADGPVDAGRTAIGIELAPGSAHNF